MMDRSITTIPHKFHFKIIIFLSKGVAHWTVGTFSKSDMAWTKLTSASKVPTDQHMVFYGYHSCTHNEDFTVFLILLGYGYWTLCFFPTSFKFMYHTKTSYQVKIIIVSIWFRFELGTSGVQRFSHLDYPCIHLYTNPNIVAKMIKQYNTSVCVIMLSSWISYNFYPFQFPWIIMESQKAYKFLICPYSNQKKKFKKKLLYLLLW
jgi:hypothetical protein